MGKEAGAVKLKWPWFPEFKASWSRAAPKEFLLLLGILISGYVRTREGAWKETSSKVRSRTVCSLPTANASAEKLQ